MNGFVKNIEDITTENESLRQVSQTLPHCHPAVTSLKPGEDIGVDVHKLDRFFGVEGEGGEAFLDDIRRPSRDGSAVPVPAGTEHNIIDTGIDPLKLDTLYAPQTHRNGVILATRAGIKKGHEQVDGKPTWRRIPVTTSDDGGRVPISLRPRLSLRFPSPPRART